MRPTTRVPLGHRPVSKCGSFVMIKDLILSHYRPTLSTLYRPSRFPKTADLDLGAPAAEFTTTVARRIVFPYAFAVPAGVLRQHGMNMGCAEIMSPWGDAVAERLVL
jgi:hypothetical protein